jgi:hypothetical protein
MDRFQGCCLEPQSFAIRRNMRSPRRPAVREPALLSTNQASISAAVLIVAWCALAFVAFNLIGLAVTVGAALVKIIAAHARGVRYATSASLDSIHRHYSQYTRRCNDFQSATGRRSAELSMPDNVNSVTHCSFPRSSSSAAIMPNGLEQLDVERETKVTEALINLAHYMPTLQLEAAAFARTRRIDDGLRGLKLGRHVALKLITALDDRELMLPKTSYPPPDCGINRRPRLPAVVADVMT